MAEFFDLANLITTVGVDSVKIKTEPGIPEKSSNDILTELFSTFEQGEGIVSADSDNEAVPEVHVKLENPETSKRKKSKKKHKHKDKKHKKKSKKNLSGSETNAEDDGHKKHKKHKKKSKRRRESCSSKSSELDDPKHKIRKIVNDSVLKNNTSDVDSPDANSETMDTVIFEIPRVIKRELEPIKALTGQIVQRQLLTSPVLPPMVKETPEDDLSDMVIPRLLETSKQTAQAKIMIKDLKNSKVYSKVVKEVEDKARAKAARMEDGELSDSSGNRTPTLSPSPTGSDRVESPSPTARYGLEKAPRDDLRLILKEKELKKRLEESNKLKLKINKDHRDNKFSENSVRRGRSRDRKRSKSKTRSTVSHIHGNGKEKSREKSRETRGKERSKDRWGRDRSREHRKIGRDVESRYKSRSRERSWERYNNRGRTRSRERKERIEIDKKKLLEIARRNAISMIQQGALPLAQQDKAIAAIQAGGKTVDELTDFCKSLSKSEALGELSSISSDEDGSGSEKGFHHPFLVKDRPNSIIMNIRDAKQLPTKTFQEKTVESCHQLRLQFPVSSGQQHRTTENEWVPVTPKKSEPKKSLIPAITTPLEPPTIMTPLVPPPIAPVHQRPVFTAPIASENVDIGFIVSQRLAAMRKLRENPHDVQALNEMSRAQTEMKTWAESKQMPGQFTGSTGAKVLSAAELSAGHQAWARKDQLVSAQPVSGGMGMALLQKMGWRPGEGLGKNKEGTLVPLQLEVKLDKRGLISNEDIGQRPGKIAKLAVPTTKTLEGKHPVSLLGEYCSKRKFGAPVYELCFECGPDHRKNFLFKVKVNGIEYKPSVASPNKKQAKAEAAQMCLQTLGLLPT